MVEEVHNLALLKLGVEEEVVEERHIQKWGTEDGGVQG